DLRERSLKALAEHRRTHINGDRAVWLDRNPGVFLAGAAAFDKWNGGEAVVTSADQPALQRLLFGPLDFGQCTLESRVIIAGVEIGLRLVGHELAGSKRQLRLAD